MSFKVSIVICLLLQLLCVVPVYSVASVSNLHQDMLTNGEVRKMNLPKFFSGMNLTYSLGSTLAGVTLNQTATNPVELPIGTSAYNGNPVAVDFNGTWIAMVSPNATLYVAPINASSTNVTWTVINLNDSNFNDPSYNYSCSSVVIQPDQIVCGCTWPDSKNKEFHDVLVYVRSNDFTYLTYQGAFTSPFVATPAEQPAGIQLKNFQQGTDRYALGYHIGAKNVFIVDLASNYNTNQDLPSQIQSIGTIDAAGSYIYLTGANQQILQVPVGQDASIAANVFTTQNLTSPVTSSKTLFNIGTYVVVDTSNIYVYTSQAIAEGYTLPSGTDAAAQIVYATAFDAKYLYVLSGPSDQSAQYVLVYQRNNGTISSSTVVRIIVTRTPVSTPMGFFANGVTPGQVVIAFKDSVYTYQVVPAAIGLSGVAIGASQITITATDIDSTTASGTLNITAFGANDMSLTPSQRNFTLSGTNGQLPLYGVRGLFSGPLLTVANNGKTINSQIGPNPFVTLTSDSGQILQILVKYQSAPALGYANYKTYQITDNTSPIKVLDTTTQGYVEVRLGQIFNNSLYQTNATGNAVTTNRVNWYSQDDIIKCIAGYRSDACWTTDGDFYLYNEYSSSYNGDMQCNTMVILNGLYYPSERAICVGQNKINVYDVVYESSLTSFYPSDNLIYTVSASALGLNDLTGVQVASNPSITNFLAISYPGGVIGIQAPLFQTDTSNYKYTPVILFNITVPVTNFNITVGMNTLVIINIAGNTITEWDLNDIYNPYQKRNYDMYGMTLFTGSAITYEPGFDLLFIAVTNSDNTNSVAIFQPGVHGTGYLIDRINVTNTTGLTSFTTSIDAANFYVSVFIQNGQSVYYYAKEANFNLNLVASQTSSLYNTISTGLTVNTPTASSPFSYVNIEVERPIQSSNAPNAVYLNSGSPISSVAPSTYVSGTPLDYNNITLTLGQKMTFPNGTIPNPYEYFQYQLPLNLSENIATSTYTSWSDSILDSWTNGTHGFLLIKDGSSNLLYAYLLTDPANTYKNINLYNTGYCTLGGIDDSGFNSVLFCQDSNENNYLYAVKTGYQVQIPNQVAKMRVLSNTTAGSGFYVFTLNVANTSCPINMVQIISNGTHNSSSQFCPSAAYPYGISPLSINPQVFDVNSDFDPLFQYFVVFVGDTSGNLASFVILNQPSNFNYTVYPLNVLGGVGSLIRQDLPSFRFSLLDLKITQIATSATTGVISGTLFVQSQNFHHYLIGFSSNATATTQVSLTGVQTCFLKLANSISTGSYVINSNYFFEVRANSNQTMYWLVSYPLVNVAPFSGPGSYKYISAIQRSYLTSSTPKFLKFPMTVNGTSATNTFVTVCLDFGDSSITTLEEGLFIFKATTHIQLSLINSADPMGIPLVDNTKMNLIMANDFGALNYTLSLYTSSAPSPSDGGSGFGFGHVLILILVIVLIIVGLKLYRNKKAENLAELSNSGLSMSNKPFNV